MTPAQILLGLLFVFIAVILIGAVCAALLLCWMAKGSPDVNGDPERDAGIKFP